MSIAFVCQLDQFLPCEDVTQQMLGVKLTKYILTTLHYTINIFVSSIMYGALEIAVAVRIMPLNAILCVPLADKSIDR